MKNKIPDDMVSGYIHTTKSNGDLEVVNYIDSANVQVRFLDTGFAVTRQAVSVRSGSVKDYLMPTVYGVGYIGVVCGNSISGAAYTKTYKAWTGMLSRCYSEGFHKLQPRYKDCSVCKEWHNFQNFAKWFDENYIDGCHLDKDIKVDGNKIYSPETCTFVSASENSVAANAKKYKLTSPCGNVVEGCNVSELCRNNGLNQGAIRSVIRGEKPHHKGWTI